MKFFLGARPFPFGLSFCSCFSPFSSNHFVKLCSASSPQRAPASRKLFYCPGSPVLGFFICLISLLSPLTAVFFFPTPNKPWLPFGCVFAPLSTYFFFPLRFQTPPFFPPPHPHRTRTPCRPPFLVLIIIWSRGSPFCHPRAFLILVTRKISPSLRLPLWPSFWSFGFFFLDVSSSFLFILTILRPKLVFAIYFLSFFVFLFFLRAVHWCSFTHDHSEVVCLSCSSPLFFPQDRIAPKTLAFGGAPLPSFSCGIFTHVPPPSILPLALFWGFRSSCSYTFNFD